MRVLQVVQKPQRRGAEVFAYQLTRALRQEGDAAQIVYLYPYHDAGALPLESADRVFEGRESHWSERFPGVHPVLLGRLLQTVDEFRPDIVQVNGSRTVKYGAYAALLRPRRAWALIYRNIGNPQDWVRSPLHYHYYRRLIMPRMNGIVGVSQTTLRIVQQFYRLSIPMVQIPPGVDPAMLTPTRSREEVRRQADTPLASPVVISIGSLTHEKRPDRLLRVATAVVSSIPELHVWLIGDGMQRLLLEQQAQALGLANVVRFLGVQTNVADYLQAADLFVLTSDTEGIPAVLQEAGYMGLPAIATNVGGVAECIMDGETGLLLEPQDEAGMVAAVERLLRDPALRARMGASSKRWVCGHFTIDQLAARYRVFYQTLASGRG